MAISFNYLEDCTSCKSISIIVVYVMLNFEWKHDVNGMIVLHCNGVIVAKQIPSRHQLTIQCTHILKKWDFVVFDGSLSDFTKKEIEDYISSQMLDRLV